MCQWKCSEPKHTNHWVVDFHEVAQCLHRPPRLPRWSLCLPSSALILSLSLSLSLCWHCPTPGVSWPAPRPLQYGWDVYSLMCPLVTHEGGGRGGAGPGGGNCGGGAVSRCPVTACEPWSPAGQPPAANVFMIVDSGHWARLGHQFLCSRTLDPDLTKENILIPFLQVKYFSKMMM